jgi:2-oxoglutarate ferredoxin oxidoreductase subunit alpha
LQWGNSGGLPVIVLAPSDVKECFTLTQHAFNLAERYRCPVFIASNKEIAMMRESLDLECLPAVTPASRDVPPPEQPFLPFHTSEGKTVPAFLPIGGKTLVRQTSSTHGPDGYITTNPSEINRMLTRMQAKIHSAADQLAMVDHHPAEGADTLIVTYGVTSRAARAAVRELQRRAKPV